MITIRVEDTLEGFKNLSERWNSLLVQTSSNNIFLTWEWLYTWTRHYLGNERLFILIACEGNNIVGIAPLYIRKTNYYGVLKIKQIEFLGTGEVCSSYLDFIVQEKKRKDFVQRVYGFLFKEGRSLWDVFNLAEIPVESSSIDALYEIAQEEGKVIEIVSHTCCPVIKLTSSVEDFLKGISGNERYNLKRKGKRLEGLGHVQYYRELNGDVQKDMNDFVKLHQMRWDQKGNGGCFNSKRFLNFHEEASGVFSERGWAHLDFLVLDGEKVAGIYGYSYNGRFYFYLPALDPNIFPEVSPGILLLYHCICHEEKTRNQETNMAGKRPNSFLEKM